MRHSSQRHWDKDKGMWSPRYVKVPSAKTEAGHHSLLLFISVSSTPFVKDSPLPRLFFSLPLFFFLVDFFLPVLVGSGNSRDLQRWDNFRTVQVELAQSSLSLFLHVNEVRCNITYWCNGRCLMLADARLGTVDAVRRRCKYCTYSKDRYLYRLRLVRTAERDATSGFATHGLR